MVIKGPIKQKDLTILTLRALDNIISKYIKQTEEIDKSEDSRRFLIQFSQCRNKIF